MWVADTTCGGPSLPQITTDSEGGSSGADKMSELVAAFDVIMGSDLSARANARSWGKLALHCEIYSITQLRRIYDVYSLELHYDQPLNLGHP